MSSLPPPPPLPSLPSFDNIDLHRIADEPDYLEYDQKGRSSWEKTVFNTGASYLMGTIGGALYGVKTGALSVPGERIHGTSTNADADADTARQVKTLPFPHRRHECCCRRQECCHETRCDAATRKLI